MKLSSSSQTKEKSRPISTTLYNPIANLPLPDFDNLFADLAIVSPNCQWRAMPTAESEIVNSKFGPVAKGSVLSYQQMLDQDYIIQYPGVDFPDLPTQNVLLPIRDELTQQQTDRIKAIQITLEQSVLFEKDTRLQSGNALWHKLRENRITASRIGLICKIRTGEHYF